MHAPLRTTTAALLLAFLGIGACTSDQPTTERSTSPYYLTSGTPKKPEENRFSRTVITEGLREPMELVVSSKGLVLFVDRRGDVRRYDPATQEVTLINSLPVVTAEGNGLLGITLDPEFEQNRYVYLFYTPARDSIRLHQSVSRFTLGPDSLDYASEKVVLEIPIEMEASAHTGGSLQFDTQGNLFISVGDNTTPFASDGFAPIDEREGRLVYDAQRSAGNMNDLRGAILRITPQYDSVAGSAPYTIPDGNLFPKDGSQGRPEIYVKGCRNPYRMSVDPATGYVYWGEIGPDSGVDGPQGPRGYDEINQARQPGFFGWPYFVGDNKPYLDYDFATKTVGDTFRIAEPVNRSPNNTGGEVLPPAQSAFIWYPYNESTEFPEVGNGGRSAMAGPVYHFDPDLDSEVKFPAYYDGALFVFDWMRNWVMAVFMDEEGNFERIERIMEHTQIDRPIDMQFGPDGALWMLEYGEAYGKENPDASLVKLEFNPNNRPPVAVAMTSDTVGAAPLQVALRGGKSYDFDTDDALTYAWAIDEADFKSDTPDAEYTFEKPGLYHATLSVTDTSGTVSKSTIAIKVGNTLPQVHIETPRNRTFYWDSDELKYQVVVEDPEDGTPDASRLQVAFHYLPQGKDVPGMLIGHQQTSVTKNRGKELLESSDCKACHLVDERTVGPSFQEVAAKYAQSRPIAQLAQKIIKGGGGVWGEHAMSAHPQLSVDEASEMVNYILTLAEEAQVLRNLPAEGAVPLKHHVGQREAGTYLLEASYTDGGGEVIGPLTNSALLTLRSARVQAEEADSLVGGQVFSRGELSAVVLGGKQAYLMFRQVDLKGIAQVAYRLSAPKVGATIEMHLDTPDGPLVSSTSYESTGDWQKMKDIQASVTAPEGLHDLYIVFVRTEEPNDQLAALDWIDFKKARSATAMR